jgi:hypothetical protein
MRGLLSAFYLALLVCPLAAQNLERRATLNGRGGEEGKCTIEVWVDGVAEVEVRGDQGILRTLGGQPATWRRFECNRFMPFNPAEFRFSGIDGRGSQEIVRPPQGARSGAIVRISDPKSGGEGYTFDLEWRGSLPEGNVMSGGRGYRNDERRVRTAIQSCEAAVRSRAGQQYGTENLQFGRIALDDNPGRADYIAGTLDVVRGPSRGAYNFSCAVNFATGRVGSVDIAASRDYGRQQRYDRRAAVASCQTAVQSRMREAGFRDATIISIDTNTRAGRADRISGSASGVDNRTRRRTEVGFTCAVNPVSGAVRTVDLDYR